MTSSKEITRPAAFGLQSFAEIFARPEPVIGEWPRHFERFRAELMEDLAPRTPYECVMAEKLVELEWEIVRHRFMREAGLNRIVRNAIVAAVVAKERAEYDRDVERSQDRWSAAGRDPDDRENAMLWDEELERAKGQALAAEAASRDPSVQIEAYRKIAELGMDPMDLLGEAYRSDGGRIAQHDERIRSLERRAREAKYDLERLQDAREDSLG